MKDLLLFLCMIPIFVGLDAQEVSYQKHVELGDVHWLRNLDEAKAEAEKTGKDIFILFQEVPGCSTCRNYGVNILQHPLVVEAIEDLFVPLTIFNNKKGIDAHVLQMYKEPSWNNPVTRVINSKGEPLLKRLSGQYNAYAVVQYIIDALIASNKEIPQYLALLADELQADILGTKETTISMFCFWSGEKSIGKLRGVNYTEAGFMDGQEVVKVRYAPDMISYKQILKHASSDNCASSVFTNDEEEIAQVKSVLGKSKFSSVKSYRKDREDKYYLLHSDIQYIPLTDLQKTRINSMIGDRLEPSELLSPRQLEMLRKIENGQLSKNNMVETDFLEAWKNLQQ